MIFWWILRAFAALGRLVIPPPVALLKRAEPNARCPVCGWQRGRLRCVRRNTAAQGAQKNEAILCEHTCAVCGARFYVGPVMDGITVRTVWPAVARTELEIREDASDLMRTGWPDPSAVKPESKVN